jgi:hypothetical protein
MQRQTVAVDVLTVGHHARPIIARMSDVPTTTGPACPRSRNSASSLRIVLAHPVRRVRGLLARPGGRIHQSLANQAGT